MHQPQNKHSNSLSEGAQQVFPILAAPRHQLTVPRYPMPSLTPKRRFGWSRCYEGIRIYFLLLPDEFWWAAKNQCSRVVSLRLYSASTRQWSCQKTHILIEQVRREAPDSTFLWSSQVMLMQQVCQARLFFKIYLFLAVVGLCCCAWASSSCCKPQLLSSCGVRASLAAEHRL